MKKFIVFFLSLFIALTVNANGKDDKTKYRDTLVNVGDLKIQSDDVFSTDAYVKAKFRFENKNDFFILLDPNKSFFYINGNKSMCKEREIILPPGTKKTKVFDVKGPNLNSVQALSLVLDGFTKTGNEKMVNMPELVADRKQKTSAGGVDIAIDDIDYDKAQKFHVRVKVTNTGNDILIVNAGIVELSEDGNVLNNIRKRSNSIMLRKGESQMIAMIYQTAGPKSTKKINWNDAFVSATLVPMDPVEIGFATSPELLNNYKYFMAPIPKKKVDAIEDKNIAMNDTRSQKKSEPKKEKAKPEKPKTNTTPQDKTQVKKAETTRAETIATEGEMSELHAAEVNFGDAGGKYYALLIGSSDYTDPNIPDLDNLPVNDAVALGKVLQTNYTFAPENIKVLKNPSRREIVIALDDLSKKVTNQDNVLIFYAGHGHYEDDNDIGYWLPTDAEVSNSANWLYNDQLTASIRKIKSLHTLLISDACFSGSIFKNRSISLTGSSDVIKKKYQLPSRKAITSGTLKTVPNKSVFIKYLLDRLEKNKDKYMAASTLYQNLEAPVGNNSTSLPQYGVINNVGDEGGDFIFIRKN